MNRFDVQDSSTQTETQPQNRFNVAATSYTPPPTNALKETGKFLAEIPHSTAVVGGAILNFLKEAGQSIVRSGIATGLSADKLLVDKKTPGGQIISHLIPQGSNFEQVSIPDWLQWATGKSTVDELGKQAVELHDQIKASPFAQKYGFDKYALPLAVGGVAINTGLDLTPFAGEEGVAKQLAKETSVEGVVKILQKIGVKDPEVIKLFATKFAETTDIKEIKSGLNILKGAQGVKAGEALTQQLAKESTDPIAQEALKYKSAEDFVNSIRNSSEPIYRGTIGTGEIDAIKRGEIPVGKNWNYSYDTAKKYAESDLASRNVGKIKPTGEGTYIIQGARMADGLTIPVKVIDSKTGEVVLEPENLLTDIYNRATKGLDKPINVNSLEETAKLDWENNFAPDYEKLDTRINHLTTKLKTASRLDKPVLQNELDGIFQGQQKLEEDFISKWDNNIVTQTPNIESQIYKPEALANELESLKYNGSLEGQYQRFKKIFPHFTNVEDGAQFLEKVNSGTSKYVGQVDQSILYSQDSSLNEVFDEFVKRYQTEKQIADELKIATQDAKPFLSAIDKQGIEALPNTESLLSKGARIVSEIPPEEKASLRPIIDQTAKTVKDKVHLMDYFQTPEFVLKKLGLEKESNLLHDGYYKYRTQVKQEIGKIIDWKNQLKDVPNASENIFKYLDGQKSTLSEKERLVAEQMRSYLAEWADKLGLPKDRRIASYITHLFDEDFLKKEFDPELAKLITDKIAGSVYDPFLEKRLGMMGYKQDVFGALDAYVKRATRKVNMDPALAALKEASHGLDVESEKYLVRLTNRINLRPTEIDNLVDNLFKSVFGYKFGVRPVARVSNTIRQMVYRGTLGLNLGSALRNLTQGTNTYAKLGEKYTLVGYSKLFSRLVTKNLDELFEKGILDDALVQDRKLGVYKSLLQKIDPVLFKFFDLAEKINRGAAYFGAKSKAIAQGKTEEEAVNFARALVRETQFAFGNLDSPVILSSDIAKSVFQLQTYNVKQIEFLKNMIKNKEFGGLLRYAGASLVMVYTIGRLFGMKPSDMIPTVRIGGSPVGNFFTGLTELNSSNSQTKAGAPKKIGSAVLTTLIPGYAQGKKTVEGISAYVKGKDTTPTGRTRFKIEQTPENLLKAGLFGKSSLPAAQEYYSNIGKKKAPVKTKVGNRFNQ